PQLAYRLLLLLPLQSQLAIPPSSNSWRFLGFLPSGPVSAIRHNYRSPSILLVPFGVVRFLQSNPCCQIHPHYHHGNNNWSTPVCAIRVLLNRSKKDLLTTVYW